MYDRGIFFNSEVLAFIGIWAFIMKIVTIKKKHQLAGAGRGGWFVTRPPFFRQIISKVP